MKVEIDVLNYNGKELLTQCIPSLIEAASQSRYKPALVVVDNNSSDGSEELVKKRFPEVRFIRKQDNKVLCAFNDIAKDSDADIMIFLNNDIKSDRYFVDPLIEIFENRNDVFLAAPRLYSYDGREIEEGRTKVVKNWGIIKYVCKYPGYEKDLEYLSYTFQGGFGAFDRKKFLELGGYDAFYLPGILEDTDICFKAWKRGYKCYYQPKSHVCHMGKASFTKRFGNRGLLAISHRNTYFFTWKNITDRKILFANIFFTPARLLYALFTLKWEIIWGFTAFVKRLPEVFRKRREEAANRRLYVKTDAQILGLFK